VKSTVTVVNNFPSVTVMIERRASDRLAGTAMQVRDIAKDLAPVWSGDLRDSIEVVRNSDDQYEVVAGTDHAAPQEFGSVRNPAHPFMRPAAEQVKSQLPMKMRGLA